nr:retrovirus-related Pol polyprotein from transposon TNT 1-94 [Tanacetum cinerariifolium]
MCALMVHWECDATLETLPVDMKHEKRLVLRLLKRRRYVMLHLETLPVDMEVGEKASLMMKAYRGNHIDEFNKLILDLKNIDIEIEDEDQAFMLVMALPLVTTLPLSYENFVETLLYMRESLKMKDVLANLNSRELKKRTKGTKEETGEGLYVKGRLDHSESHLKRDYPMKKSSGFVKKGKHDQNCDSSDDEGNAYFGEALVVVGNDKMIELVMDSCGSYHMAHRRDFVYDFKGFDGDSIQLELQGAQWNREADVCQVSKDDAVVALRRLEDNTD